MTEKISGYAPEEWVKDDNAKLIITTEDNDEISFESHYINGEPSWPPLSANGVEWQIKS
jgi:hypothetical protein